MRFYFSRKKYLTEKNFVFDFFVFKKEKMNSLVFVDYKFFQKLDHSLKYHHSVKWRVL